MRLLTGPAGSGKTHQILDEFRAALRRHDSGVRLLTPTATMAQHLQNHIAREGFVFRPGLIQTLSRFVDSFAAGAAEVSKPLLYRVVEEAAPRVGRPEFAQVAGLRGFYAALARAIEELSSAGCDAERLAGALPRMRGAAPLGEAFAAVYREVERGLGRRGLAMRGQRLLDAAAQIARTGLAGVHTIWLDGFYALPDPELAVIEALCRHADVTLTLPPAPITEPTRARLLAVGFEEQACRFEHAPVRIELCATPAIEREADEIARRILEQAAAGRAFREMGVIVRCPEVYEAILRATFDRFGIPARFYFDADLSKHSLVRFLSGVVDAMLGGWDHEAALAAVRLAPGLPSDEFDFAVREQLPGRGLAGLQTLARGAVLELLRSLGRLEEWRKLTLTPALWAVRLKALREWCQFAKPEPGDPETAAIWRMQAAALDLFEEAMDECARALEDGPVSIADFWDAAKSILRLTPLRVPDARRNVVHVLDAHEARQWQLPIVYICGLVQRQFPKFHTPAPFFPELARAQLKQAGIRLRTAADFEEEERFLFDWSVTRATESLTLTYPRFDARGQQNLPSQYLENVAGAPGDWRPVRPRPQATRAARPTPAIASADLIADLSARRVFRPTALERYMQCPFQFFGDKTLRLKAAPDRPEERLNFLVRGNIVHAVLAELAGRTEGFEEVLERVFHRICKEESVPASYRTEAWRERILADLKRFLDDTQTPRGVEIRTEQDFQYALTAAVEIKGRIDRIDMLPDGRALVTDYKYSNAQNTKDKTEDASLLQPQLYVLAAERFFGFQVAGMYYYGLRGELKRVGWENPPVTHPPFPPQWREQGIETVLRIVGEIRAGRIAPHPADTDKCRYCDYRDVCRFEAAASLAEGA